MSFLQTLFLAGIAAAIIPVLIHLLNRPRARVIRFSTLEFVKRLQIRRSKRLRIREILLLVLRMLLIALIAVAFARPALKGNMGKSLGGQVRTSACIVLDASYSMAFNEGGKPLFDRAKARALDVVNLLKEGDESLLFLASTSAQSRFDAPAHNFRLLASEIDRAVCSSRGTDIPLSLREAKRALDRSRNPNREIYLVSDMQRSGLRLDSKSWSDIAGSDSRLFLLPVGKGERPNVAITGAELYEPRRFGETIRIRATMTNYSRDSRKILATLVLDGARRGTASLSLDAGGSASTVFSLEPGEGEIHTGEIRIEDDGLAEDDTFYFTLHRPGRLKVLVVAAEDAGSLFFLRNALDPEGGKGLIDVTVVDPVELRSARLDGYHAVFLVEVPSFDEEEMTKLERYRDGGGGIVIVPGDAIDTGVYNREVLPRLAGGSKLGESLIDHGDRPAGVEWVAPDHPVFALFPRGVKRAFEDLLFARHFELLPGKGTVELARTSDGRPFLLEAKHGAGRTMLFSAGFDLTWGDFPTEAVFLPLIHEIVRYLYAGGALYRRSLVVGWPYRGSLAGVSPGAEFTCTKPDGEVVALQPRVEGDDLILEFEDTDRPGIYLVKGGAFSDRFAVNLETDESDLSYVKNSDLSDRIPVERVIVVPEGKRLDRTVLGSRFGRELWWGLLVIALLLLLVELAVSQGVRRAPAARG